MAEYLHGAYGQINAVGNPSVCNQKAMIINPCSGTRRKAQP